MAGIEERETFTNPIDTIDAAADVLETIAAVMCQAKDGLTEGAAMGVWHVAYDRLRAAYRELLARDA